MRRSRVLWVCGVAPLLAAAAPQPVRHHETRHVAHAAASSHVAHHAARADHATPRGLSLDAQRRRHEKTPTKPHHQDAPRLRNLTHGKEAEKPKEHGRPSPRHVAKKKTEPAEERLITPISHAAGRSEAVSGPALYIPSIAGGGVRAPCSGAILYAGKFRSYGQLIILGCAHDTTVVLGGMDRLRVQVGRRVRQGQLIGVMPKDPGPPPRLYAEVRRDNVPQDPGKFFH